MSWHRNYAKFCKKKSQNRRNQGFSYYFCLMFEGSGSGQLCTYWTFEAINTRKFVITNFSIWLITNLRVKTTLRIFWISSNLRVITRFRDYVTTLTLTGQMSTGSNRKNSLEPRLHWRSRTRRELFTLTWELMNFEYVKHPRIRLASRNLPATGNLTN
jgi:CRISPR/Cas system-associated protein Cas10 (large subunit of type III CRISPR-Cas system)